ncbi:glycoside hydrolase family 32 protein [Metabacillus bambusae]|uniref:Sucrose-6-phosphate hydrolase n=1 Tax=Metabacillus bambusae TaxID=2795218 RepID=A0ABS3N535_9BACI|nr:sucrose-6-phosphate hydrolase [Metabacillus bambusae]MBO1512993.1 sucrose-6-phosphate hydrolase [Metabacillus bambusae]
MEWTTEMRYRRIEDVSHETLETIKKKVNSCQWRQNYHIQPETGLLNDPNGFSFFNGEYHLFYQWFPLGPVHGLKYWYHTKSKDLVHWENVGIAIKPDQDYDSHGAYSGSAIEHKDELYLMYTGNTRNELWERHPYQVIAVMNKQGEIKKLQSPVIPEVPKGYTDHFRDPKVWKSGDLFYAVIGAQRENNTGCSVLFQSMNLTDWTLLGEMKTEYEDFGYMWECPDYFDLDGKGVFVFSPQGLKPKGDHYQNIYQSGYLIGQKLDLDTLSFSHGDFHELDRGFDFYAPQTTLSPDGRRLLVGWMGLPEIEYPTDQHDWAHCLTLPRELKVKDGRLLQQPAQELTKLRKDKSVLEATITNETMKAFNGIAYELIFEITDNNATVFGIEFRAKDDEKTVLKYDANTKKIVLDRSMSGDPVGESFGTSRQCSVEGTKMKFHLFVDTSSVEIFVNDGEEVFTSRIFPRSDSDEIRFFANGGSVTFIAEKWDI